MNKLKAIWNYFKTMLPTKDPVAGWSWEWGSTTHPIIGHAILASPFAIYATWYIEMAMASEGAGWLYAICGGIQIALGLAVTIEYTDERAYNSFSKHQEEDAAVKRITDVTAVPAEERAQHRPWSGWDWKDFAGWATGGMIASFVKVVFL